MTKWSKWLSIPIAVLIVAAVLYTVMQNRPEASRPPKIGSMAPPFTVTTLDGKTVNLSDYRGKGVLLNFWASWCNPCVDEMPRMNEAYRTGLPGVEIFAVNVGETKGSADEFAAKLGLSFPVFLDPSGEAAERYGVVGLPSTFLIDGEGWVKKIIRGEMTDTDQILTHLKEIQSK